MARRPWPGIDGIAFDGKAVDLQGSMEKSIAPFFVSWRSTGFERLTVRPVSPIFQGKKNGRTENFRIFFIGIGIVYYLHRIHYHPVFDACQVGMSLIRSAGSRGTDGKSGPTFS